MRVFQIAITDSTQLVEARDDATERMFKESLGKGKAVDKAWVARLQRMTNSRGVPQGKTLGDATSYLAQVNVLVLGDEVKATLEDVCGISGQWLAVDFPEKQYWLLNPTHVIDALDLTRSDFSRLQDGRVAFINQFAFKPEMLGDEWLFKVATCPYDVLCTERFVALADAHRWTGFFFDPVWDSEHQPFRLQADRAYVRSRPEVYGPEGFVTGFERSWPQEWRDKALELKRNHGSRRKG